VSNIKSYSVGNGDMFYVEHGNGTFTMVDCCFHDGDADSNLDEIADLMSDKAVTRFISTHPDQDHISGLEAFDDRVPIINFYCVDNQATKPDETDDFKRYRELRDSTKAFALYKGVERKWLNKPDAERRESGLDILWPKVDNDDYKAALEEARDGGNANNICPIVKYSLQNGASATWMGDLETDFLEAIEDEITLPQVDILFAPHHGRDRVPAGMLDELSPQVIVLGEADSDDLEYYPGWNTMTQNSAGDILFECRSGWTDVFTGKRVYLDFLSDEGKSHSGYIYAGSMNTPR
jgi:beta-lactamase superfamily II metal-dependent hydrolase